MEKKSFAAGTQVILDADGNSWQVEWFDPCIANIVDPQTGQQVDRLVRSPDRPFNNWNDIEDEINYYGVGEDEESEDDRNIYDLRGKEYFPGLGY